MPRLPFKSWPRGNSAIVADSRSLQKMYRSGFSGVQLRPKDIAAANERFDDDIRGGGGWPIGSDAARMFAIEDYGKGKLSLNFLDVLQLYPEAFPGPAQERGDCVGHTQRLADLVTVAVECKRGKPDEISGLVEGPPDIPADGQRNGCFSSEWPYWHRGYNSDGWSCSAAASVSTRHGVLVRKRHNADLDLTHYSGELAGRYGRKPPPESFEKIGRQHLIRTSTRINGVEELRDFIAAGYGVASCGGEGFSSKRNSDGVSKRRGSWAHAMAVISFDDRPNTVKKYGPLALIANSWSRWNSGPRGIMETDDGHGSPILIPHGCFWARWSDIRRRTYYAMSSAMGWKPKRLHRIKTRW